MVAKGAWAESAKSIDCGRVHLRGHPCVQGILRGTPFLHSIWWRLAWASRDRLVPTVHIRDRVLGTQAVTDAIKRMYERGAWGSGLFVCGTGKRGPRKIFRKWKRTSLQRVIVTREGVGVCSWRLMNGEERTRIFTRKRKRRLLSEQGGAYATTNHHRRSDS